MSEDDARDEGDGLLSGVSRRDALKLAGGGSLLAGTTALGVDLLFGGAERLETTTPSEARAEELAVRFAPDLYFGAREKWFPTDPRRYQSEVDGRTVVDGFDALDGYTAEAAESDGPPAPTVFYNAVAYRNAPLTVVQFWFYSAFDQFTTNFHWHDWEVLHVFVDTSDGSDTPVLHVASAHSRRVPNNEHLDPEPTVRPAIISEVGSHSSALGMNARRESFQRLPGDGIPADITNSVLEALQADLPAAYGLPRDEGFKLAYLVPELDGAPIYEHERLPNVGPEDLVAGDLVVRDLTSLASPPEELPLREHATSLTYDDEGDYRYDLLPMDEVTHIDGFEGPQLSFEFAVPDFAEDAVAGHITTTDRPWTQSRFTNPTADITDPEHRRALSNRYDAFGAEPATDALVGAVTQVVERTDSEGGLTTEAAGVEAVCLVESEHPTAVPTWNGVLAMQGLERADHRLTVNAPGFAPYAQRFTFEGGQHAAGTEGEVALVAGEDATKLRADAADQPSHVARLRVIDEFAGALYDAPPDGDRFGVYVHNAGSYTAEITDENGELGAFRVDPDPGAGRATIENPRTGKASLVSFLVEYLGETTLQGRSIAVDAGFDPEDLPGPDDIPDPEAPLDVPGRGPGNATDDVANATDDVTNATTNVTDDTTNTTENLTDDTETVVNATTNTTDDAGTVTNTTDEVPTTVTDGSDDADGGEGEARNGDTTPSTPETTTAAGEGRFDGPPAVAALRGIAAASRLAGSALAAAEAGEAETANRRLRSLRERLEATALAAEGADLPPGLESLFSRRLPRFRTRLQQAIESGG